MAKERLDMTKITNRQLNAVVIKGKMIFLNNVTKVTEVELLEKSIYIYFSGDDKITLTMSLEDFNNEVLRQLNSNVQAKKEEKQNEDRIVSKIDQVLGDL